MRQLEERLQLGTGRIEHDLLFYQADGSPLHPERFSRTFADRVRHLGLTQDPAARPAARLGNLALAAGVDPKVVQDRLGHAKISITLDVYSHVIAGLHSDAAEKVAGTVFGAR